VFRRLQHSSNREKSSKKKLHNNNRPQASRLKQTRRLKFAIDQTLRLEYTFPLAKDFQVTLSGGGALIRHKVAFFAEDEAAAVVGLLDSRGVQVIRKRGGAERKRGSNFASSSSGLRPISEGFEGEKARRPTPPSPSTAGGSGDGTMAILRRKSTGSFDKQQSHLDQRQSQRQLKHSMSTISSALLQRRNSMASRTKKAAALMAAAGASPNLSASKKTAPFPATAGSGKTRSTTKWYEEIDYYDEEEIEEFNRETSTAKNSRHSLETDEEESDENEHEIEDLNMSEHEHMRLEAAEATGRTEADGIMAKLFRPRSPPEPPKQHTPQQPRPRAPTNEKLEKYKFMLINIEPDADIFDPGTFAFEMQEHEDGLSSYLGFEFNDYPAEVLCPPFPSTNVATALQQQQKEETDLVSINSSCGCSGGGDGSVGGAGGGSRSPSPKLKPNRTSLDLQPTWIRRSFEQLHSVLSPQSTIYGSAAGSPGGGGGNYSGGGGSGIKNPNISQSTGNLASDISSGNVCETNSGSSAHGTTKEQNEQQSETLPAYNSESGSSNKETRDGGGGQLQLIRRQLLSGGSPTLTSECL